MDQAQLIEHLEIRAKAVGLSMREVCNRAGIAPSTPSRWKSGTGATFKKVQQLDAVIKAEEAKRGFTAVPFGRRASDHDAAP